MKKENSINTTPQASTEEQGFADTSEFIIALTELSEGFQEVLRSFENWETCYRVLSENTPNPGPVQSYIIGQFKSGDGFDTDDIKQIWEEEKWTANQQIVNLKGVAAWLGSMLEILPTDSSKKVLAELKRDILNPAYFDVLR